MTKIIITGHPGTRQNSLSNAILRHTKADPFNDIQSAVAVAEKPNRKTITNTGILITPTNMFYDTIRACQNEGHSVVIIYAVDLQPGHKPDANLTDHNSCLASMELVFLQHGIMTGIDLGVRLRSIGTQLFNADQVYIWQDDGTENCLTEAIDRLAKLGAFSV